MEDVPFVEVPSPPLLPVVVPVAVGVGVAVANAYDELKAVANFTTTNPVEKGGFAEAVYKFIKF